MSSEPRDSIWSVSAAERRWYSILFPIFLIGSVLYYTFCIVPWYEGPRAGIGQVLLNFGALGVSSAILSMTLVAGGSLVVVSYQWLHDKVKARREKTVENWLSQEHDRTYEDGATIRIKAQGDEAAQSSTPLEEIRGQRGVIQGLHGWVSTQGQGRGIYMVFVGGQTYLIDENWLEPES